MSYFCTLETSVKISLNNTFSHNVEFKGKPGANPDLLLLDKQGEIIERIDMGKYDRKGCNQLLLDFGFWKKLQVNLDCKRTTTACTA